MSLQISLVNEGKNSELVYFVDPLRARSALRYMGKRTTFEDSTEDPLPKRRKFSDVQQAVERESTEVKLLTNAEVRDFFFTSAVRMTHFKTDIQAFKGFLEAIVYGEDSTERSKKKDILLELAKSEADQSDASDFTCLVGLMQSWGFAAQSNNDGLMSAIPAVLALLVKTVSSLIECWKFGIQLCKTLLRRDQLKLIARGLSANKSQEFLISPCLRLLTEIVSFDGGVLAKRLYLQRETTFKRLDFFLGMSKPILVEDGIVKQKPSIRLNAVHYLLANINLQASAIKSDIISQPRLVRGLFQSIGHDHPSLAIEILDVCQKNIATNPELAPDLKSHFFNESTLLRITELRDHQSEAASNETHYSVGVRAQELLLSICTNAGNDTLTSDEAKDLLDLDSSETYIPATLERSLRREGKTGSALASFIQHLKPFSNAKDKDLLLKAFHTAPELVADYFSKKKSFSYDPKLSATWIGYSAFLYSVIQLPLPEKIFKDTATAPHIVLELLLPEPLNRKSLERSLNQKHPLIKLFATRLLVKALQKLDALCSRLKRLDSDTEVNSFLSRLKAGFSQRCPEIATVTAAYKACNMESSCIRENLVRLVSLYYKILPSMALEDSFDVSVALADRLSLTNDVMDRDGPKGIQVLELDSFLEIARQSPNMRWWHKPEKMILSPFTTMLQLHAESNELKTRVQKNVRTILKITTRDYYIVSQAASPASQLQSTLDALVVSLRCYQKSLSHSAIYKFLDNCVFHLIKKPIKYEGDWREFDVAKDGKPVSLLAVVFAEQWQFTVKSASEENLEAIACWIALLLKLLIDIGEDRPTLEYVLDHIRETTPDRKLKSMLRDKLQDSLSEMDQQTINVYIEDTQYKEVSVQVQSEFSIQEKRTEKDILLCKPPIEAKNHPELTGWLRKDPQEAIDDGTLGKLILCLCSAYKEIRRQALSNMRHLMSTLMESAYSGWQLVYTLFGAIVESAEDAIQLGPYPYFAGQLGACILQVLTNPLHAMYGKVSKFLTKSPRWNLFKLPSQWVVKVLLHPPTEDDCRYREIFWVLEVLFYGLCTPEDMELYRRCNVIERILAAAASSSWPRKCDNLVLQVLCRCSYVEGSATLVTRCGILTWIQMQKAIGKGDGAMLDAIRAQILQTSDRQRIAEWQHKDKSVEL